MSEPTLKETIEQIDVVILAKSAELRKKKQARAAFLTNSKESKEALLKREGKETFDKMKDEMKEEEALLLEAITELRIVRDEFRALEEEEQASKNFSPQEKYSIVKSAVHGSESSASSECDDADDAAKKSHYYRARVPSDLPKYSRIKKEGVISDPLLFIRQYEANLKANEFPQNRWVSTLPKCLCDVAMIEMAGEWRDEEPSLSWQQVRSRFLESQHSPAIQLERTWELQKIQLGKAESIQAFTERFVSLLRNLEDPGSELMLIGQYVHAIQVDGQLHQSLKTAIAADQARGRQLTLTEVFHLARAIGRTKGSLPSGTSGTGTDTADTSNKSTKKLRCNYCKIKGHTEQECRKKAAAKDKEKNPKENKQDSGKNHLGKCSLCNKRGHDATNCWQKERVRKLLEEEARQQSQNEEPGLRVKG